MSPRHLWIALLCIAALPLCAPALAQTGVDDDRVSLPGGPGSLEGFGDDVEIDPNMGAMSYSIPIELPPGFPGAMAGLSLSYASGAGSGPVGIGWSLAVPRVERMTSRGVPLYDATDEIDVGGNELVLVDDSEPGRLVYRSRFEKDFKRYLWMSSGGGAEGYWVAELPDGGREFYGAARDGIPVPSARTEHPEGGTARYLLVEQVDVWGHGVRYAYDDTAGASWPLLAAISWLDDGTGTDLYSVELRYEDRPDFLSDASVGFEQLLTRRLSGLVVRNGSQVVREYALSYQEDVAAGGFSRLARVETYGVGGQASGELHPGVQTFDYSQALGVECTGADCESPVVVDMGTIPGGVDIGSGQATLIDIDANGLPDVLDTSPLGVHRFYINTLTPAADGESFSHTFVDGGESGLPGAGSMQMGAGSDAVQVVDVNGDGLSDLLDTTTGSWLENDRDTADWKRQGTLGDVTSLLGLDFSNARFIDIDEDKRIDIVTSTATDTTLYHNDGDAFSVMTVAPLEMTIGSGSTVQFADINGDGLNDPVQISSDGAFAYRLNLGHGRWGELETIDGLTIDSGERSLVDLEDLNGDSISDVVIVSGNQVKYAINRNGARFDAFVTVQQMQVTGAQIPDRTNKTVLYADMNGNGSEDVVWFDPSGRVTYLELFPTRPNLLTRIDNGLGSLQRIDYGTAAEHAARAQAAGEPWTFSLAIPMQVVDAIDLFVTVSGSEDGSGLHNVTSYAYHDGFYDGAEKQYRGFQRVIVSQAGIESQESSEQRYLFDVGREHPWRNGLQLELTVASDGRTLHTATSEYDACALAEVPDPDALEALGRRGVYWPCMLAEQTRLQEGLDDESLWLTTRTAFQYDGYGNQTLVARHGIVGRSGDEDYTRTTYAAPAGDTWLVHFPARVEHSASDSFPPADTNVSVTYYDGEAFVGLPEGQVERGFVSRQTTAIDASTSLDAVRARHDEHGNAFETLDPNAPDGALDGPDHRRSYAYDATGRFLTTTELHLDGYALRRDTVFETDFGKVVEATAWMLVEDGEIRTSRDSTFYRYDDFGRLAAELLPGDEQPSVVYTYELGAPFSRIVAEARSTLGGALDERIVSCLDGKGRTYQTRTRLPGERYQVDGFTVFNARGAEVALYQAFTSDSEACESEPPASVPVVTTRYDAAGRVYEVEQPSESIYGERTVARTVYRPLATDSYDAEDSDPDSAHFDTPTTWRHDGLERPVERVRTLRAEDGSLRTASLTLHYDGTNSFAGYTDAEGNRHELTVDLAERITAVTNPSTGTTLFDYDDAGNLLARTDARGVTARYTYDGQNRLAERFDPADRENTLVTWHYDRLPEGCEAAECTNLAGQLAAVRYPIDLGGGRVEPGMDRFGYDVRRRNVLSARRFGLLADLVTRRVFDNRNRLTSLVHPDGNRVESTYDVAGRLISLPGYVETIDYDERGLWVAVASADGSRLERALDDLQRETSRSLTAGDGSLVFGHALTRNRADHIRQIVDTALAGDVPSADATIAHDAWYRPTRVELGAETLTFGFDTLDRLVSATSSDTASAAHRGELSYASQPLTATAAGSQARSYDAAGQMTARGELELGRDALGRISTVGQGGQISGALVYADIDRVMQRSDTDGTLVLYGFDNTFEVRDGVARAYVRMDRQHLARHESTGLAGAIYPNPDGDDEINAGDAYVAQMTGDESLPLRTVLGAAAARLLAEQEDATTYLHTDFLGSVVAATDQGGELRGQRGFYPFGQVRFETGHVDVHGFTGQEHDASTTGMIHMQHRELDPVTGRWDRFDPQFERLGADALQQVGEAASGYAYVANSPFDGVDPSGLGLGTYLKKRSAQKQLRKLKEKRASNQGKLALAEGWQKYNNDQANLWKGMKSLSTDPVQIQQFDAKKAEHEHFKSYYSERSSHYTQKIERLDRQIAQAQRRVDSFDTKSSQDNAPRPPTSQRANDKSRDSVQKPTPLTIIVTPPSGSLPTIVEE